MEIVMPVYIAIVAAIIIAAGWFGGIINYLFLPKEIAAQPEEKPDESPQDRKKRSEEEAKKLLEVEIENKVSKRKSVTFGIAASLLVPLFLTMIQSDLLAKAQKEQLLLYPLAGLCLVAAVIGRRFIEGVSAKVLQQVEDLRKEQKDIREQNQETKSLAEDAAKQASNAVPLAKGELLDDLRKHVEIGGAPATADADDESAAIFIGEIYGEISRIKDEIYVDISKIKGELLELQGKPAAVGEELAFEKMIVDDTASPLERWKSLCDEYRGIRQSESYNPLRTSKMTAVVRQLVALAPKLEDYPLLENLRSPHQGQRLGAFAYLYSRPDFGKLSDLLGAVRQAEAFAQYWGLQALGKMLEGKQRTDLDPADDQTMKDLLAKLKADSQASDRYYLVYKILKELG